MIVAVDLAARFSAVTVMGDGREVLQQYDTWRISERTFISMLVSSAENPKVSDVVIEDLPHGLKFATLIKRVCRLQGRIEHAFDLKDVRHKIMWCPPALWQRYFDGVWRKGPVGSAQAAEALGYLPPDLHSNEHGKDRQTARKVETDYVSSFLIAWWALDTLEQQGTLDVPSTSRSVL
jgi:hypothetical protein